MADSREKLGLVLLDPLAPAAAKPELPSVEFAADEFGIDRHARGQPGDPGDERLPVRFSGGDESQHVQWRVEIWNKRKILPDAPAPGKGWERRCVLAP